MQFTTNYDLNKPDLTDKFEVEHQNQNMDIIDGEMKSLDNATSFLATNLVTNGNFANGTTGWTANVGALNINGDIVNVTAQASTSDAFGIYSILSNGRDVTANHKYYIKTKVMSNANAVIIYGLPSNPSTANLTSNIWLVKSAIQTPTVTQSLANIIYRTGNHDVGDILYIDYYMKIDLTTTFGAGKEPTLTQCDLMFATWKDTTFQISTIESLENNKANRVQEAWITPTLVNSWIPFDSATYDTFQYMKDEMGFVHLRGMVKSGTTGVICTLPVGYRPLKTVVNPCISNNVIGRVDISAVGVVTCIVYNNTYVSLQGISFKAEQ